MSFGEVNMHEACERITFPGLAGVSVTAVHWLLIQFAGCKSVSIVSMTVVTARLDSR